jgi:hypothetical protein
MNIQAPIYYQYLMQLPYKNSAPAYQEEDVYQTSAYPNLSSDDLIRFQQISKKLEKYSSEEIEADITKALQEVRQAK